MTIGQRHTRHKAHSNLAQISRVASTAAACSATATALSVDRHHQAHGGARTQGTQQGQPGNHPQMSSGGAIHPSVHQPAQAQPRTYTFGVNPLGNLCTQAQCSAPQTMRRSCSLRHFEASLLSLSSLFWDAQSVGISCPVPCGAVAPYVGPGSRWSYLDWQRDNLRQ